MPINQDKIVLSVETATRNSSLAILRGAETHVALWRGAADFSASDNLLLEIERLLLKAATSLSEVNLLAVTVGPGSFTGLRIGLSIVKGLAAAREIPVIGVPTLRAMAFEENQKTTVCVILAAGRDEFFWQVFRAEDNLMEKSEIVEKLQTDELKNLLDKLKNTINLKIIAPSETHLRIKEFISSQKIKDWILTVPPENTAVCAGQIALQQFKKEKVFDNSLIYGRAAIALKKQTT